MPQYDNRDSGFLHTNTPRSPKGPTWRVIEMELSKELLMALIDEARAGRPPTVQISGWDGTARSGKPYIRLQVELKAPDAEQRMTGDRNYQPHQGPATRPGRERLPPREVPTRDLAPQPVRRSPEWDNRGTGNDPQRGRPQTNSRTPPWEDQGNSDFPNDPLPEDWK